MRGIICNDDARDREGDFEKKKIVKRKRGSESGEKNEGEREGKGNTKEKH